MIAVVRRGGKRWLLRKNEQRVGQHDQPRLHKRQTAERRVPVSGVPGGGKQVVLNNNTFGIFRVPSGVGSVSELRPQRRALQHLERLSCRWDKDIFR